jgi:hypothetical protein
MTRVRLSEVSTVVKAMARREAEKVAGPNAVLSRTEQAKASAAVQAAAEAVRAAKGKNARVTVDAIEQQLAVSAAKLIGDVNKPGSGAAFLSKVEATAAFQRDPVLGQTVLEAYKLASGHGLDVDGLAAQRVNDGSDPEVKFKVFATVAEAEHYQDPDGFQVSWLVPVGETLLTKTYVSGRNDLWAQKFEVDRLTGAVAILAEH